MVYVSLCLHLGDPANLHNMNYYSWFKNHHIRLLCVAADAGYINTD